MKRLWYLLTAHLPRLQPRNETAMNEMQLILHKYFGVPDEPKYWATVAGNLSSVRPGKKRVSYAFLANCATKLDVTKECQRLRMHCGQQLQKKLEELTAAEAERVRLENETSGKSVEAIHENKPDQQTNEAHA